MTNMQKLLLIWTRAGEGGEDDGAADTSSDEIDWSMFGSTDLENDDEEVDEEKVDEESDADPTANVDPDKVTQEGNTDPVPVTAPVDNAPEAKPEEAAPVASAEPAAIVEPTAEQEKQIAKQRTKFLSELESGYQISKEDSDLLLTEPEKVLPRLMANATMQILEQAAQMIQTQLQALPEIIKQTQTVQSREAEVMGMVQKNYPALLENDEGKQALISAAKLVKDKYPNESVEKRLERSAKLAYAILGREVAPTGSQPAQQVTQKAPKPTPHVPAKSGTGTNTVAAKLSEQEEFYANIDL